MLRNLEITTPEVSIEGIIIRKYLFKGQTMCISIFDPKTDKHGIGSNFQDLFRWLKDEVALGEELQKIDSTIAA